MVEIADFIRRVILDKESPEKVSKDVAEFRKDFQNIHYCFEKEAEAHSYMKITGR